MATQAVILAEDLTPGAKNLDLGDISPFRDIQIAIEPHAVGDTMHVLFYDSTGAQLISTQTITFTQNSVADILVFTVKAPHLRITISDCDLLTIIGRA